MGNVRQIIQLKSVIGKGNITFIQALIFLVLVLVCLLSLFREFDRDEFEAIHTAWKLNQGEVINVDFFQHHHPLFYYLLTPIIKIFGEGITTLVAARTMMLLLLLGILKLTYELSEAYFNNKMISWLSVLLVISTSMFAQKAIEIRPDVPQSFFALLSIFILFKSSKPNSRLLLLSSLFLGISFLFLQKTIFVVAGMGLLHIHWVFIRRWKLEHLMLYWIGFLISISPYFVYLIITNQLENYLFWNWILNMNFTLSFSTFRTILDSFTYNHLIWIFYIAGVLKLLKNKRSDLVIISSVLLVSVFIVKAPYRQYFMPLIPLMSIIAASSLIESYMEGRLKLIIGWIVIIPSAYFIYTLLSYPNKPQLEKVKWVLEMTKPDDHVYDGDIRFNLYRKDIDYFWYSTNPDKGGLITYQRLKTYSYDINQSIRKFKPKIISSTFIENLNNSEISDYYHQSREYPNLYIRKE